MDSTSLSDDEYPLFHCPCVSEMCSFFHFSRNEMCNFLSKYSLRVLRSYASFLNIFSYLLFNFNDYPNGMVTLFNLLVMGNWQVWMEVIY